MLKKAAIIVVSGLILIATFAYFVYPTPYKYFEQVSGEFTYNVRVNIITGEVNVLNVYKGWVQAQ